MQRRDFFTCLLGGLAVSKIAAAQAPGPFIERARTGQPHKGKVLAAIQPHSDDIALICAGTVAKLINEGYTGYMIRATNDDMGDDVGEPGSVGENVLRNEREVAQQSLALGLKRDFGLNYSNHRMSDISRNELICRLIFLFRLLKVDTVFCYDPWAHDEENPDHYVLGHCVEAACWMAGRVHDYPEQFAAGLEARAVTDKYYYAQASDPQPRCRHQRHGGKEDRRQHLQRRERTGRASWLEAARGAGQAGQETAAAWATTTARPTAITSANSCWPGIARWARNMGVEYAEAFHYVGPVAANIGGTESNVDDYVKRNAVPVK